MADFDTTREVRPSKTTLGEEIYTGLCDRVGASSLSEDLSGASFRSICHKSSKGWTGTKVDTKLLPPVKKEATEARRLSIAKVEAMARNRADLIEAFDAIFPDTKIPDPLDDKKQISLHTALDQMTKRLTALYEGSPYSTKGSPEPALMPATTQALGALMETLANSDEGREALARISGREGYRPLERTLGAVRTLLAYPDLRRFSRLLLARTGPGGPLEGKFQHLMRVAEQEMRTLQPDPKAAPLTVDEATLQPSRARFKIEILGAALLGEDDAYKRNQEARYLASRDLRGFVIPSGAQPGKTVPAPFADLNKDGYADVDLLGRFVNADGEPLLAPPPFQTPLAIFGDDFDFDDTGRATYQGKLLFRYVDTSRTLLHAVMDDLRPLAKDKGDNTSTLMNALEGSYLLYGPKKTAKIEYGGKDDRVSFDYEGFDAEASPLIGITHATGQFLGAPESDDYLGSILALHEKHPEKTARALQLAWSIWNRSKNPEYAQAVLDDKSTFWEEMTDWLAKVARIGPQTYVGRPDQPHRSLFQDLSLALVDPAAIKYLPGAFAAPMQNTDRIGYDSANLNGPPINKTTNVPLKEGSPAFQTKVNRSLPDQGNNRSAFQRFAHIIAAANHVNTCNKEGAKMQTDLKVCGLPVSDLDVLGLGIGDDINDLILGIATPTYKECELLDIKDLGIYFVDATLPANHPRRARLEIKDPDLLKTVATIDGLLQKGKDIPLVGNIIPEDCVMTLNQLLSDGTGINGISTMPSARGLMRLVFFGAQGPTVDKPEYLDELITGKNNKLNQFVSGLLDPVGTEVCGKDALGVNSKCQNYAQTLRGIEPDTFFVAETPYLNTHPAGCYDTCTGLNAEEAKLCKAECDGPASGFFEGLRPTLTAFASYGYQPSPGEQCTTDAQGRCAGEQLFVDLMVILDKHWSSGGSSLFRYEDFLAWTFQESDLFGTMSDLVKTMDTFDYTSPRVKKGQKRSALEITNGMLSFLFDPQVAASLGMTDRAGKKSTVTNDGKTKPQLTPYDLFVQSLRGFDQRFDTAGDPAKKARWRSARSALVDQFLLADNNAWKNQAIARALPVVGRLAREQVNANCPTREDGKPCTWARTELTDKLARVMGGPLFAAINDLNESLRDDEELRAELHKLIAYLLETAADPDSFALTLTSLSDLIQVANDEEELAPILRALSSMAAPGMVADENGDLQRAEQPGTMSLALKVLQTMMDEPEDATKRIDRYNVMDHVLPKLVTPVATGKRAPLEVILDTISDVQRIDSTQTGAFSADDYKATSQGLRTFMVDDYRGMEQFYTIVRGRNGN